MKKQKLYPFLAALLINLGITSGAISQEIRNVEPSDYVLEKVLIFSRHGLRSPIDKDPAELAKYSPYQWAKWDVPSGYLTPKGTILETYFGQYLGQWLSQQGLLTAERCASGEGIFAYANSIQRTIATGQAILAGGFAGCNVSLQHQGKIGDKDPIFHAVAHKPSETLIQHAKNNVNLTALQQKLAPNYALLSEVIGYVHSPNCMEKKACDLGAKPAEYVIEDGKSVRITGAISTAKKIVSGLLLAYYVGKSASEIANGNVDSEAKWQVINEIKNEYYRALFKNNVRLAQNVSQPLLQFIQQQLDSENKISLLVGHDSNIVALLGALNVAPYELDNSLENIPIGGKLLFQIWQNKHNGERKFKLEYVYQTTAQLVNLTPLSLTTPPNRTLLSLKECKIDQNGWCNYERFREVFGRSVNGASGEN